MGLPCVNSRCSTEPSVDGAGRLNIDVRLDPNRAITCVDGLGLGVLLDPNANNIISESAAGLLAIGSGHQITTGLGGTPVSFVVTAQTPNSSNFTINNNSAKDRLLIITTKFRYTFTVVADGWETDGTFNVVVGGDVISESFALGGGDGVNLTDDKVYQAFVTVFRTLPASGSIAVTAYGSGRKQLYTPVVPGSGFSGSTFTAFHDVVVIDSPVGNLFTVT